jgi:hypothetical protein
MIMFECSPEQRTRLKPGKQPWQVSHADIAALPVRVSPVDHRDLARSLRFASPAVHLHRVPGRAALALQGWRSSPLIAGDGHFIPGDPFSSGSWLLRLLFRSVDAHRGAAPLFLTVSLQTQGLA